MERKFVIKDLEELEELAGELLQFAGKNRILAFFGEMGAGKTTFIRYLCKRLGANENVTSPTFSLVNEYHDSGGRKIFHFDFYRIEKEQEAFDIGCEEYFNSGSFCLVEWPEKILNLLPHPYVKIQIKIEDLHRIFIFSNHG